MDWVKEFDGAVTICDNDFIIVYMNDRSIKEFHKYGGNKLIGQNLLDCHNSESAEMMREMLVQGKNHTYQRTKSDGRIKVIHQTPWTENGEIMGLVEVSFYLET